MPADRRAAPAGLGQLEAGARLGQCAAVAALGDAVWTVLPLVSPGEARALSLASPAVSALMVPACERAAQTGGLARELLALPFTYTFPLQPLGSEALNEVLPVLKSMRVLRRRELVGHGAGFAPTDAEAWAFQSGAELQRLVAAARAARACVRRGREPALLLGATLRLAGEQTAGGPLATASMGVEWAEGPAADPLQLGLRLVLGPEEQAEVDLELGSGGWSPWAETWALRDGTLGARVAVCAALPRGGQALLKQELCGRSHRAEDGSGERPPCQAEGVRALREALGEAGEAGVRAAVCVTGLLWQKEAPAWCPPEVQRVTTFAHPPAAVAAA